MSHQSPSPQGVRQQLSPIEVRGARSRQRPRTDFAATLRRGADAGLQSIQAVTAGYLPPGGAVVSAALSGAGTVLDSGVGGGAWAPGAGGGDSLPGAAAGGGALDQRQILAETARLQREGQLFNVQLLHVQERFARDQHQVNTLSNLMKKKDDTIRNTLSNLR